ncbi:phosphoenolpyruvate--protein phosphotransferase [Clostridium thermarum]|uniref:phosphoenolpyruvate--protein phosphotransferase n=1 Tax=Clostridium thermarum TaxID=1716543 RepID=UPI0011241851|nr:phosphoenolpyruvate--protein phosphotransferase [Clostridium thermarum]
MKKGIAASKGYAIGKVVLIAAECLTVEKKASVDPANERCRLENAISCSIQQLEEIRDKTAKNIGESEAVVFDSHLSFLFDEEFSGAAIAKTETEGKSAEEAISEVVDMYMEMISLIDDEYMRARAADIKDVGNRVLRNLMGKNNNIFESLQENSIIVAHDLTPSDTAQLDKDKVAAFVTDVGSRTSHSAIMARTLEIPAVVGLEDITSSVKNGDIIIVDGVEGMVLINPDEANIKAYEEKRLALERDKERLKTLINTKSVTKSGKEVIIAGNIGSPADVDKVIENGGDGVGLFRTEFLYMDRKDMPSEEEQFEAYRIVAEKLKGKPVVIRTLDIGGDKKLEYLPLPEEENPFLGFRAIRLCLSRTDIFKTQLRAILRASAYGKIQIMFPMISSLEEFFKAKELLKLCMEELKAEGKEFNENIETGIMIEVPAAAIMADEFAKHVDFFSIGTNDLIQYTLAADRMNENVAYLYNPMHPAVLRLIKMTIDAAHKEGKWCGMCGEMAGDENAIPTLLEYGLDEFSMSPSSILSARQIVIDYV